MSQTDKKGKASRRIAFGGIAAALSLLFLFLSGVFPFAEYTCPALAGIVLIALVIDFGKPTAWIAYGAVALLALIATPNKESAVLFVFFLGYYPILKSNIEQLRSRVAEWAVKLVAFNLMGALAYLLLINVFGMTGLLEEMSGGMQYGLLLFWGLGNIAFVVYDLALSRLIQLYCLRVRPKFRSVLK